MTSEAPHACARGILAKASERSYYWTADPINGLSFWEKQCSKGKLLTRWCRGSEATEMKILRRHGLGSFANVQEN